MSFTDSSGRGILSIASIVRPCVADQTASAAAQQQADGGGLVERKLQPGRWVLAALSWHQTIAGPVAEILVMRSRAGAAIDLSGTRVSRADPESRRFDYFWIPGSPAKGAGAPE